MAFTIRHPVIKPTTQTKRPDCDVIDANCMTTMTAKKIFPVRVSRSTLLYRQNSRLGKPGKCAFVATGFNSILVLDTARKRSLCGGTRPETK